MNEVTNNLIVRVVGAAVRLQSHSLAGDSYEAK